MAEGLSPTEGGDVALTMLCDLVKVQDLGEEQVDQLVAAAELRLRRVSGAVSSTQSSDGKSHRRGLFRRRSPEITTEHAGGELAGLTGPKSVAAQWIKLTAINDRARRSALPEDPAQEGWIAVVEAAFELAVKRRFSAGTHLRDIALCIHGARRRVPTADLPFPEAESLVRQQLAETVPTDGIDLQVALTIKAVLTPTIIDELAMFDHEVDELLCEAEQMACQRGYRTTELA